MIQVLLYTLDKTFAWSVTEWWVIRTNERISGQLKEKVGRPGQRQESLRHRWLKYFLLNGDK